MNKMNNYQNNKHPTYNNPPLRNRSNTQPLLQENNIDNNDSNNNDNTKDSNDSKNNSRYMGKMNLSARSKANSINIMKTNSVDQKLQQSSNAINQQSQQYKINIPPVYQPQSSPYRPYPYPYPTHMLPPNPHTLTPHPQPNLNPNSLSYPSPLPTPNAPYLYQSHQSPHHYPAPSPSLTPSNHLHEQYMYHSYSSPTQNYPYHYPYGFQNYPYGHSVPYNPIGNQGQFTMPNPQVNAQNIQQANYAMLDPLSLIYQIFMSNAYSNMNNNNNNMNAVQQPAQQLQNMSSNIKPNINANTGRRQNLTNIQNIKNIYQQFYQQFSEHLQLNQKQEDNQGNQLNTGKGGKGSELGSKSMLISQKSENNSSITNKNSQYNFNQLQSPGNREPGKNQNGQDERNDLKDTSKIIYNSANSNNYNSPINIQTDKKQSQQKQKQSSLNPNLGINSFQKQQQSPSRNQNPKIQKKLFLNLQPEPFLKKIKTQSSCPQFQLQSQSSQQPLQRPQQIPSISKYMESFQKQRQPSSPKSHTQSQKSVLQKQSKSPQIIHLSNVQVPPQYSVLMHSYLEEETEIRMVQSTMQDVSTYPRQIRAKGKVDRLKCKAERDKEIQKKQQKQEQEKIVVQQARAIELQNNVVYNLTQSHQTIINRQSHQSSTLQKTIKISKTSSNNISTKGNTNQISNPTPTSAEQSNPISNPVQNEIKSQNQHKNKHQNQNHNKAPLTTSVNPTPPSPIPPRSRINISTNTKCPPLHKLVLYQHFPFVNPSNPSKPQSHPSQIPSPSPFPSACPAPKVGYTNICIGTSLPSQSHSHSNTNSNSNSNQTGNTQSPRAITTTQTNPSFINTSIQIRQQQSICISPLGAPSEHKKIKPRQKNGPMGKSTINHNHNTANSNIYNSQVVNQSSCREKQENVEEEEEEYEESLVASQTYEKEEIVYKRSVINQNVNNHDSHQSHEDKTNRIYEQKDKQNKDKEASGSSQSQTRSLHLAYTKVHSQFMQCSQTKPVQKIANPTPASKQNYIKIQQQPSAPPSVPNPSPSPPASLFPSHPHPHPMTVSLPTTPSTPNFNSYSNNPNDALTDPYHNWNWGQRCDHFNEWINRANSNGNGDSNQKGKLEEILERIRAEFDDNEQMGQFRQFILGQLKDFYKQVVDKVGKIVDYYDKLLMEKDQVIIALNLQKKLLQDKISSLQSPQPIIPPLIQQSIQTIKSFPSPSPPFNPSPVAHSHLLNSPSLPQSSLQPEPQIQSQRSQTQSQYNFSPSQEQQKIFKQYRLWRNIDQIQGVIRTEVGRIARDGHGNNMQKNGQTEREKWGSSSGEKFDYAGILRKNHQKINIPVSETGNRFSKRKNQ